MKELLEKYAELKRLIKEAEEEIKNIQPMIIEQAEVGTKYDIGIAVVEYSKGRSAYVYSETTQLLEADLKKTKKEEEQMGIATVVEGTPFLVCKFKK